MSFKLLAIKPLKGCNEKFLKNLKQNQIYQFYNNYEFNYKNNNKENEILSIEETSQPVSDNFYYLKNKKINISAIVGKNGSGKSSIVEMLYAFIFCLSFDKKIGFIEKEEFIKNHIYGKYKPNEVKKFQNEIDEEIKKFEESLDELKNMKIEIYYLINNSIIKLKKDKVISITKFNYNEKIKKHTKPSRQKNTLNREFISENFFYSIVVNYSFYGLNTNEFGLWLKSIFHKNDSYQTPIVLNPMRTEGNIDINTETYLTKSRILSNILQPINTNNPEDSLRNLVNNKIAEELIVSLDFSKFTLIDPRNMEVISDSEYFLKINDKIIYLNYSKNHRDNLFKQILNAFVYDDKSINNIDFEKLTDIEKLTIEYIFRKIIIITEKYSKYKTFKGVFNRNQNKNHEKTLQRFLSKLINDESHIVFKLRQAIHFFYYKLYDIDYDKLFKNKDVIKIDKLSKVIHNEIDRLETNDFIDKKNKFDLKKRKFIEFVYSPPFRLELLYFLPPSFFKFDIKFSKSNGSFNQLSSGEKQKVYIFSTIIYHLRNLKSVQKTIFNPLTDDGLNEENKEILKYNNYNLIFDELEMYFHPEMQRTIIFDMLKSLSKLNGDFNLNIIFITHSPFILSDIPNNNILFLEVVEVVEKNKIKSYSFPKTNKESTFAANIHEMLTNGFFMESTKGEFALSKIRYFLEFYKKVFEAKENDLLNLKEQFISKSQKFKRLINLIGEEQIKSTLHNHFEFIESKLMPKEYFDLKIERLKNEIMLLEKNRDYEKN